MKSLTWSKTVIGLTLLTVMFALQGQQVFAAYCPASGGCGYEYIGNVNVGTINNSSDCSGYADYTAMATEMAIGTGYAITVTNGQPYGTDKCGIWADWNQDLDFDDPCETIAVSGNPGGGPYTATITAPVDANLGDTRLRICITDSDYNEPASCGTISYGEFEDYTISVVESVPAYCGATGGCGFEHIGNVNVGTINNSSDCNGYTDYTTMVTEMAIGTGYAITVTNGQPYGKDKCGIWADWNQDLDFDDPCETIAVSGNPGGGPYIATITAPVDANLGDTRLRICITDSDYDEPTPCGTITWGEFEDYTISVTSQLMKYGGGSGTEQDPYLIYTPEQMNTIGTEPNDWDKHFKLMADIDLASYTGTQFNIIGVYEGYNDPDNKPFAGVFDGNAFTISNFTYNSTETNCVGLFRYVDEAEIKNLGLIDPNVNAGTGNIVGSLVGFLDYGNVTNCYAEGGHISGEGGHILGGSGVGGLVGQNRIMPVPLEENNQLYESIGINQITNCYTTSSVSGSSTVGGLVGSNQGTIKNCYAVGNVVGSSGAIGGLVGFNLGTINNCYAVGNVVGSSGAIGGLVGENSISGRVSGCYATGGVVGDVNTGGLVGSNYAAEILNCYATGSVTGSDNIGGLVGSSEFYWYLDRLSRITNCYAIGDVSGTTNVGGLLGYSDGTSYNKCFWDSDINPDINGIGNAAAPDYDLSWIGHWKMNDNDDQNQVDDSSGNDNHGTAQQITSLLHTDSGNPPYLNGALTFNGTSDYITTPMTNFPSGATERSASLWIKWDGSTSYSVIFGYGDDAAGIKLFGAFLDSTGNLYCWNDYQNPANNYDTGIDIAIGDWTHIVLTYDGTNVRAYKDGALVDTTAKALDTVLEDSTIGKNIWAGLDHFAGSIDNVMIFDKELSQDEISYLYNNGDGTETIPDGSLDPNVIGKSTAEMQTKGTFTDVGWDFISETVNGCEDIWRLCNEGFEYPKLAWEYTLGDFVCPDGVDMRDYTVLANQWQLETLSYDVAPAGGDGIVNFLDWAVFADAWQDTTDANDLRIFAQQWLSSSAYSADIAPAPDGDGWVDELDLAIMANNWLTGLQ